MTKLKHFIQDKFSAERETVDFSRSDPKDIESQNYERLCPTLNIIKADDTNPWELIYELEKGQKDPSNFLVKIDLSKNGFDEEKLATIKNLVFDLNNNFLVLVAETCFYLVDLRKGQTERDQYGL